MTLISQHSESYSRAIKYYRGFAYRQAKVIALADERHQEMPLPIKIQNMHNKIRNTEKAKYVLIISTKSGTMRLGIAEQMIVYRSSDDDANAEEQRQRQELQNAETVTS